MFGMQSHQWTSSSVLCGMLRRSRHAYLFLSARRLDGRVVLDVRAGPVARGGARGPGSLLSRRRRACGRAVAAARQRCVSRRCDGADRAREPRRPRPGRSQLRQMIASLIVDRMPERIAHLVIIDGGIATDGQSIFGRIPTEIAAKRRKLAKTVNGTEVLPFAPAGSLVIDDPELAASTHRQLTPHPLACYTKPIRLHHPAGNGRPMTYIACTRPRYPVSAGMHEKVQAMPHIRFRPIEAGHNCIISAPDLVARELLETPL